MENIDRLMQAGIISAGASFSQDEQDFINSLTPDEVSTLISAKSKLTPEPATPPQGPHTPGIVF